MRSTLGGDSNRAPDFGSDPSEGVWQDDGLLVMRVDARLPDRCIKCNSEEVLRHKLVKALPYSRWKLPLFLFGFQIVPARIMARLVKQVSVEVALCKKHSSNWGSNLTINLPSIAIGLVLVVFGFYRSGFGKDRVHGQLSRFAAALGMMLFAIGALSSVIGGDPVYLSRLDSGYVWLKGAGESYLASIPSFTKPRSGSPSSE